MTKHKTPKHSPDVNNPQTALHVLKDLRRKKAALLAELGEAGDEHDERPPLPVHQEIGQLRGEILPALRAKLRAEKSK